MRPTTSTEVLSWNALHDSIVESILSTADLDRSGRRQLPFKGDGGLQVPAAQQRLRTSGLHEHAIQDDILTLWRDTHGWCTYCRMLWGFLEENRVPYKVEKVNLASYGEKRPDFLQDWLSPKGLVPVLQLGRAEGERVLLDNLGGASAPVDEMLINLEQRFAKKPLWGHPTGIDETTGEWDEAGWDYRRGEPTNDTKRRVRSLLDLKQVLWVRDQEYLREGSRAKGKGKGKHLSKAESVAQLYEALDWVDKELSFTSEDGPWFFGNIFSIVDLAFAPVIERAFATAYYYKGVILWEERAVGRDAPRWPHIQRWLKELGTKPSYRACCSDLHTHAHIHKRLGRWGACVSEATEAGRRARTSVDEHTMFAAGNFTDAPELMVMPWLVWPCRPLAHDCLEAAIALTLHWRSVVGAACSNAQVHPSTNVEELYRAVVIGFLAYAREQLGLAHATQSMESKRKSLEGHLAIAPKDKFAADAARALRYTADRVSVPRDMGIGAARVLRASLTFVAKSIDPNGVAGRVPIPCNDRWDQNPEAFHGYRNQCSCGEDMH